MAENNQSKDLAPIRTLTGERTYQSPEALKRHAERALEAWQKRVGLFVLGEHKSEVDKEGLTDPVYQKVEKILINANGGKYPVRGYSSRGEYQGSGLEEDELFIFGGTSEEAPLFTIRSLKKENPTVVQVYPLKKSEKGVASIVVVGGEDKNIYDDLSYGFSVRFQDTSLEIEVYAEKSNPFELVLKIGRKTFKQTKDSQPLLN